MQKHIQNVEDVYRCGLAAKLVQDVSKEGDWESNCVPPVHRCWQRIFCQLWTASSANGGSTWSGKLLMQTWTDCAASARPTNMWRRRSEHTILSTGTGGLVIMAGLLWIWVTVYDMKAGGRWPRWRLMGSKEPLECGDFTKTRGEKQLCTMCTWRECRWRTESHKKSHLGTGSNTGG
jgi:hypothetical protein